VGRKQRPITAPRREKRGRFREGKEKSLASPDCTKPLNPACLRNERNICGGQRFLIRQKTNDGTVLSQSPV
jgi:hypothetical protein